MNSKLFSHTPVLLREVLDFLSPQPGQVMLDCTAGGGGHSRAILSRLLPGGKLIALDRDKEAVEAAKKVLEPFGTENFLIMQAEFSDLQKVLQAVSIEKVDGIVFDLGVSSHQLDEAERGFSYRVDAPLDMRMDRAAGQTAAELVNERSPEELTRIIRDYGEERWAKRIAFFICEERKRGPITTTGQLADLIKKAIPQGARREGPHPARRTFQALRIAVNRELEVLAGALEQAIEVLNPRRRLAVITFHSLEDRLVKRVFQEKSGGCACPPDFPVCVCGKRAVVKILTGKPVQPSKEEMAVNPRSRSAKLRVVEKEATF
ncbi:MAG: 16S rRNA (cytosine(1402)-N(4))-methyltransferase RsmH [Peptococcaceae bacterium]|jgi:16S rRNA (cytosine1402-N4)-methyltransferase|nr:16S rRNA (cytosine(1402)-N(4))-methyltransferase RsmH [Peptococcaceae bacterium]MDH7524364.1 16S rRNA (cytosine(1402)-N(4))-methyltransferase RsmH [Peptococcaceae bacterium]